MTDDDDKRPAPEALLKFADDSRQGKLKIFLGYAPGVGKTYAMLEAGLKRRAEGWDVVAAYVESHGRFDTDALLAGLEAIPPAKVTYRRLTMAELDLDAVLARRPRLALVDELPHSNAPGSRHEKRWQDVEELLAAGIDVYTTLNVQHFESLKDVVAQITGITVRETVPDRLLDEATDIRLVDLPPEELLQRLGEGKVYVPKHAATAMQRFFTPGNLIALREISLRRAASRIDDEMRSYMESRAISGPWPAAERLLVCVSGSPYGEQLIRTTRRLADEMKAPWYTVYVETPNGGRELLENRARVWRDLRLAETLGAEIATLTATSVAAALIDFAVRHNVTKIVVGKPCRPRWRELLSVPLVDRVIRLSGPIDVYVVSFDRQARKPEKSKAARKKKGAWSDYLKGLGLVLAATVVAELAYQLFDPVNLVMIYLLVVVVAAIRLGRRPAIATSLFGVLAFDFFFVPPHFSFVVYDPHYLLTFAGLLLVGVVISTLVSQSRERAEVIRARELQTASLYYLARDLAAAVDLPGVMAALAKNAQECLAARLAVFLPEGGAGKLKEVEGSVPTAAKELAVAGWAFKNRRPAGRGTETLASADLLYLPLETANAVWGALGVEFGDESGYCDPESRRLLGAYASQAALAIERVRLAGQSVQTRTHQARDALERALLNSIYHDLHGPLGKVSATLDAVERKWDRLTGKERRELFDAARQEFLRLQNFTGNLLDLTTLEDGSAPPKLQKCGPRDLLATALRSLGNRAVRPRIRLSIPRGLPKVRVHRPLMVQALANLLDNALRYSEPKQPVEVTAWLHEGKLVLEIADRGPGLPEAELARILLPSPSMEYVEQAEPAGLGLAMCKGTVEAHEGEMEVANRAGGGLAVTVRLPLKR